MSKYRPGYIPGKRKMTVYVDPDVHRALRVRAAETGESMGNIVERAIRRALGMERLSLGRDEFAAAMGFADYEALIAASESVVTEGDVDWYVTPLADGRWAAWDDAELSLDRVEYFATREAAVQYHLDAARSAGIVEE